MKKVLSILAIVVVLVMAITCTAAAKAPESMANAPGVVVLTEAPAAQGEIVGEMDFSSAVVLGIPLVLVVIGLVQILKMLGVQGKGLIASAVVIGLIIGLGYQYSLGPLVGFTAWFDGSIYGLGLGLVAAGVVNFAKSFKTSA